MLIYNTRYFKQRKGRKLRKFTIPSDFSHKLKANRSKQLTRLTKLYNEETPYYYYYYK